MLRASIRLAKEVPRRSRVCSVLSIERAIELAVLAARAPWSSSARQHLGAAALVVDRAVVLPPREAAGRADQQRADERAADQHRAAVEPGGELRGVMADDRFDSFHWSSMMSVR
ncbi:hypothetical protein [Burkholderia gladioli]|uniref:hypothetical protein n=1 Tax=Burkholderia gladioli TaxID=28095 RepID=UPI001FC864EC|nr:hypothetical protein [Burkholderia gladioli]